MAHTALLKLKLSPHLGRMFTKILPDFQSTELPRDFRLGQVLESPSEGAADKSYNSRLCDCVGPTRVMKQR